MDIAHRTLIVALIMLTLTACSDGASTEQHIVLARQYIANSEYSSATIELKNALQKDQQSAEARWLLGSVYLDSGDVLSAEKELRRSLELGWPATDVTPALAESLLAQGRDAEVLKLREAGLQPEAEADFTALRALAALRLGENQKARKLIDKALLKNPESTQALLAKARILASQGDINGADEFLDSLIKLDPDNGLAWSLRADIRMAQQQPEAALAAYTQAVELQPDNYSALYKRASLSLQLNHREAAATDTSKLLEISPQHPGANYLQGVMHLQAGDLENAITTLSLAEPAAKQLPLALYFLSSAQLLSGNLDQASILAGRYYRVSPESVRGRKLLATVRLQQAKYGEVQELLAPVLDANPNDVDALNLMANALLRDHKTEQGISLLSRVATLRPDSPTAQVRLGAGLLVGGQDEDAEQHITTALELDPEFQQADILMVLNHLQSKDYEAAIKAAQAYRLRQLTSTTPLNLLGRVYLEAGRQDDALASFEKAVKLDPGDPAANHNLAQLAIAREDMPAARRYYGTILEAHADHLPALIQLALLEYNDDNGELLVEYLDRAMAAHPAALEPRLLLGRYYLSEGRPEKIAALFSGLAPAQQKMTRVLELIALAQLAQREHGEAKYTLQQLMMSSPDSAALHHLLAMAASGADDVEDAERQLRRAVELDESYLRSRIALAKILLAQERIDELKPQLDKLVAQAPDNQDVILLQAAMARNNDDGKGAVALAERAFSLAPSTKTVLALASHKEQSGDLDGALADYRSWLSKNPDDVTVKLAFANRLQQAQKLDQAITQYEQILQLDQNNIVALNNLAWYTRENNPVRALKYARQANKITPNSAEVLDTLAVVEYINEAYSEAQRSITLALRKAPDNPSLLYHSAMIRAANGDTAYAIRVLEDLIADSGDFPEMDQAKALLTKLGR